MYLSLHNPPNLLPTTISNSPRKPRRSQHLLLRPELVVIMVTIFVVFISEMKGASLWDDDRFRGLKMVDWSKRWGEEGREWIVEGLWGGGGGRIGGKRTWKRRKEEKGVVVDEDIGGKEKNIGELNGDGVRRFVEERNGRDLGFEKFDEDYFGFNRRSTLNFFHLHKTGGVSHKTRLYDYFSRRFKKNGDKVEIYESCRPSDDLKSRIRFTCDWFQLEKFSEEKRNSIDVSLGHQYMKGGIMDLLNRREVRSFTIMRHPLDRKVSFFHHFFVRALKRDEKSVSLEEVKRFVLYNEKPTGVRLGRNAGPNYVASRFLSNGLMGFNKNTYVYGIAKEKKAKVIAEVKHQMRSLVFVGLQEQEPASLCLLRKTVEAFNKAHGIGSSVKELEKLDTIRERLNTGSYKKTSAKALWNSLTSSEKELYRETERVDLALYREAKELFSKQVQILGCQRKLKKRR